MKIIRIINNTFKAFFILITTSLVLCTAISAESTDYEPVGIQRLYNKINGAHLLCSDQNEISTLTQGDWINEGTCFYAPNVKTKVEVKRFYNPSNGNHIYTSDQNEWENLLGTGWKDEGTAFYGAANQLSYPIYRLYSPEGKAEPYLYTSDENEYNSLTTIDPKGSWRQEGIGWYAESLNNVNMYSYDTQKLNLPSVKNIRQLGGYVMPNGKKVKNNILIRSGSLDSLSDSDKAQLENVYHLREIIDLRSDETLEHSDHPDIIPEGANYHFLPAMGQEMFDNETLEDLKKALSSPEGSDQLGKLIIIAKHNGLKQIYNNLLNTELAKNAYKEMFQVLLNNAKSNNSGAVLWHCTQGKDRAGIASALILSALGADDATIRRDYSLTTRAYQKEIDQMKQAITNRGLTEEETHEFLGLIGCAYPENIQIATDSVGSLKDYLTKNLELTEDDLKVLQDFYLE